MSLQGPEDAAPPHIHGDSGILIVCPIPSPAPSQNRRCSPTARVTCCVYPEELNEKLITCQKAKMCNIHTIYKFRSLDH